jgi:hypothetical protein
MQGFLVLADAINRTGSTEPEKIQAALKANRSQAGAAYPSVENPLNSAIEKCPNHRYFLAVLAPC